NTWRKYGHSNANILTDGVSGWCRTGRTNMNRTNHSGGCGLVREKDAKRKAAPRVVLAGQPGFAARAAEYLYLMGLDVRSATSADDLHALAMRHRTAAVI